MNRTVTTEASARFGEELADVLRRYQEQRTYLIRSSQTEQA